MQKLKINYAESDFAAADLSNVAWNASELIRIDQYWNGVVAPDGRHTNARILRTDSALCVRFEANQTEPLIVAAEPDLRHKAMNLWDRDVVEIFVAPDRNEPGKYFEFEASPTGEWLDVALDSTSGTRVSDWEYKSGMEVAAKIEDGKTIIAMKIPWTAFGKRPELGDVWLGNILRCVGEDPDRGYLAWSPTTTEDPNFHVPDRFGEFHFVK